MDAMSRTTIEDRNTAIDVNELRPIGDYVLVAIIEKERSVGGILLPKGKGTEIALGRVLALGTGIGNNTNMRVFPIELNVDDYVVMLQYSGEKMALRQGPYRLIRSNGIWAKAQLSDADSYEFSDIEPRFNCVLLDPVDETQTRSGIYLPRGQNAEAANRLAKVVKAGPGIWHHESGKRLPIGLEPGQTVVMMRYAGADVRVNGKWLRLCQEDDIHCIVEGL